MEAETKRKLEQVANEKLDYVLICEEGSDEGYEAFDDGMKAIDKLTILEKQDFEKAQKEKEFSTSKKQKIVDWVLKGVEIAAVPVVIAVLNIAANNKNIDTINEFESKGGMYTSQSGRSIGKLFKWK